MRPPNQPPPAAAIERIYKPTSWDPRLEDQRRERSELLKKIADSYDHVHRRLAMATAFKEETFTGAGLSVGLLDPATNIIYNTLTASDLCADEIRGVLQHRDMAERSLAGLVAFLTSFLRYLADWEAVRYLLLAVADTDLVYAMRLIAHDRCLSSFQINSDTALMCAALASKHMDPHHLVRTWLSPIRPLEEAVHAIQNDISNFTCVFNPLHHARKRPRMPMQPLDFAWKRALELPELPPTVVPYRPYQSMKFALLQRIHIFYLKALALLPTTELRPCYHHSMLEAGHCYGPFDPVDRQHHHQHNLTLTALPERCFKYSPPMAIRCGINLFPCPRSAVVFNVKLTNGCTISKKVKALLASYALASYREPLYLHVICGVNHNVSGPEYCMDGHKPVYIYQHTHVNFLASRRDGNPELFCAELSNNEAEDGGGKVLCCPVSFPQPRQEIRCLYCDYEGTKIVHPAMEEFPFKGRDSEFQKMVCGIDPYDDEPCPGVSQFYTNSTIIWTSSRALDHVGHLGVDDWIYTDFDDDSDEEDDSDDYSCESE